MFNDEDLERVMDTLDEFKQRHKTIQDSIEDAYRIGNQLQGFVEKQIIIDYHLMGKQDILEKKYPELMKQAKKFLGYEAFYELQSWPFGVPLEPSHDLYKVLIKKQQLIQKQISFELEKHRFTREQNPNLPDPRHEEEDKEENI